MSIPTWILEIEARAEKGRKGPWVAYPYDGCVMIANQEGEFIEYPMNGKDFTGQIEADANLLAHSRTDIPRLIEALKVAVGALDNIQRTVDKQAEDGGLWSFRQQTIFEAYLQQELRKMHQIAESNIREALRIIQAEPGEKK